MRRIHMTIDQLLASLDLAGCITDPSQIDLALARLNPRHLVIESGMVRRREIPHRAAPHFHFRRPSLFD